jgi:4-hydroxy-2-oxoheptanedioate aldolase
MPEIPRLNGAIRALAAGETAFATFAPPDPLTAQSLVQSDYDAIVFEMEHNAYDIRALRDSLQYLLDRYQIAHGGTLAPAVTPIVRIPPNGSEMNQFLAKQVLDLGAYGIVFPHVSTVEEARNAVAATRYPRPPSAPRYEPAGVRGDSPRQAARYWGLTHAEYYERADVWPLAPDGEVLVVIMCEEVKAIRNLPRILKEVSGIGVVLIGEGDLSQDMGLARQYDHPDMVAAMAEILAICKDFNVPCGHPHVDERNVERLVAEGYRWLMPAPTTSYAALERGRRLTNRG